MHKCKSCYSNNLESIIPLGQLPLANALTNHPELNCKKYNLEVMLCKLCGLAQLKDTLDPKDLFLIIFISHLTQKLCSNTQKILLINQ